MWPVARMLRLGDGTPVSRTDPKCVPSILAPATKRIGQDLLRGGAPEGEAQSAHRVEVEPIMERTTRIGVEPGEVIQDEGEVRGIGGHRAGHPRQRLLGTHLNGVCGVPIDLAAVGQGDRSVGGVGVVNGDDDVTPTGQVHHE